MRIKTKIRKCVIAVIDRLGCGTTTSHPDSPQLNLKLWKLIAPVSERTVKL
jgi:hypothetical protein